VTHPESSCFHCGLPVPSGADWSLEVEGVERAFCCPGCEAVCRTIVGAGLQDYYRHRDGVSAPAAGPDPEVLERLALYDRPDIQAGFTRGTAGAREASLILENIRCPACLWLNQRHLRSLEGVLDAEVDFASERAWVRWDPERIRLSAILRAVADIGYLAHPYDPSHRDALVRSQKRRSTERLIFAGLLMMPLMQFSFATYVMGQPDAAGRLPLWVTIGRWTSLVAAAALLAYSAQEFFLGAWSDLRARRLGMDVPIAAGLGVAFLGSLAATVSGTHEVYFDSIGMFVFFVLLARRLELKGRVEAARTSDRLARVVPRTASRLDGRGAPQSVAVVDLAPGDRLRIRPGETMPVDAELEEGESSFDAAVLTGEAAPVTLGPGETVVAGARNLGNPVVVRVVRGCADSAVEQMQRRLKEALRSRPAGAALADLAARWLVRALLAVASATAAFWLWVDPPAALPNTVAVLIVTCPCALALATPVALAIGAARLAAEGMLPLRMSALDSMSRARVVAFDKTGTLTTGELVLDGTRCVRDGSEGAVLPVAAALERDSEHPIARAFRAGDGGPGLEVRDRRNEPGAGVSGRIQGRLWRLGRPERVLGPEADQALWREVDALAAEGRTVVALGDEDGAVALFALRDELRPGVDCLLGRLRAQGVETIAVLSGDRQASVDRLAADCAFDEALGDLAPEAKVAWVRDRQSAGQRVMMVGDGINDASTLSAADASVSFAHATDLAQAGSDLLLLGGDIGLVSRARALARRLRRVIVQNLLWAAGYNVLAVPAAALGLVPPWAAAIGMSASSLLVVANSLRLRRGTRPPLKSEAADAREPVAAAALGAESTP
jgi:Cu2+-exporting ATPase